MSQELKENIKDYFNKNIRDREWDNNKVHFQTYFRSMLKLLKLALTDPDFSSDVTQKVMYRLLFGYNGIGKNGISTKLKTLESIGLPANKKTDDHVFGAVEIGKFIKEEFERNNLNIDYMVDVWLYEHLFLWSKIKVSKNEHQKDKIERNKHSIQQKMNLEHYKGVSKIVF
jgi:hypothetical protein